MSGKRKYMLVLIIVLAAVLYVFLPNFSMEKLTISYPYDGAVFPPEIAPPTFRWDDRFSGAEVWSISLSFASGGEPVTMYSDKTVWSPTRELWETIKVRSIESDAIITISGIKTSLTGKLLARFKPISKNTITIATSADSVSAPIFYRDVPLPFDFAREKMELIQWRLGDISKPERPPVVLENLPVCGNCHSFTPDGSVLGMDVDSGGDKGSYAIAPVEENIFLSREKLITWSDYKREENDPTFGLLAQISPNGKYACAAVKDRVIFLGRKNLTFSQLFFPIKGMLAVYNTVTKDMYALSGADNPDYVQANPSWSPDNKHLIFARTPITEYIKNDKTKTAVLNLRQSAIVLGGEEYLEETKEGGTVYAFNLYRIPFNEGRGGTPEPIPGASNNGMSNYFAKYSPDGKWIVFCKARSFMLLQPDSKLYIMPADLSGEPRLMNCNTNRMNSWHSWSPNSRWLVFSSKVNTAYTELFLTHIDEKGNDSPPVLLESFSSTDRARNIPEFVNISQGGIAQINESFVDYYSYARKGDKLISFGILEEAEKAFRISIEMNPDYAIAHRNLGALLSRLGRDDEALEEYKIALKLDPKDPNTHGNIGTINLNRKEYDNAAKKFKMALKYDPRYAHAIEGLGVIDHIRGDIEGARKKFETAVGIDTDMTESHFYLGILFMQNNQLDEAEREFNFVIRQRRDASAYARLGTIYFRKRELDEARNAFTAALEIDPQNTPALHNLGILYMETGEFEKAEQVFRTVYRMNPNNPNVSFMLGKVLSMNDRSIPEAIALYSKALSIAPGNIQGHIELGNLYLKTGNKPRAIQVFEQAIKLDPDNANLKMQIDRLKQE